MALRVDIASPCTESWDAMRGDERVRFCDRCQLHVFNVSELSQAQVLELMARGGGVVCGRIFRRKDGTVLTKDCPVGLARGRRALGLAAVTVAALVVGPFVAPRGALPVDLDGPGGEGWSAREAVKAQVVQAREYLRTTRLFGPLVEELYPRPAVTGRIHTIGLIRGSGSK